MHDQIRSHKNIFRIICAVLVIGVSCNSQEKCFNFLHGLNYTYVVLFVPILSLEKDYKLNAVKVLGGARRMG